MASLARTTGGGERADGRPHARRRDAPGGAARLETRAPDAARRRRAARPPVPQGGAPNGARRVRRAAAAATPPTGSPSGSTSRASSSRLRPRASSTRPTRGSRSTRSPRRAASRSRRRASTCTAWSCSSPLLLELPPLVACEIQLRLLVQLGIATEASLWRDAASGNVEPRALARRRARRAAARARPRRRRCAAAAR